MDLGVKQNIGLPQLNALSSWGVIDKRAESDLADGRCVSASGPRRIRQWSTTSTGNQQRLSWDAGWPGLSVLISTSPGSMSVQGESIGYPPARRRGTAVMLISSELRDLHLSDR
jgi:ABC-type sugar transport system ATPase subunit